MTRSNSFRIAVSLLAGACLLLTAGTTLAQRDAGSKIRGDAFSPNASEMYGRHAQDHAQLLYHYGKTRQAIPRETVQYHTNAIRQNVQAQEKELAKAKAEHPKDKEVQQLADQVHKHNDKVMSMCKMADSMAPEDKAGMMKMCECCMSMHKDLAEANKAHTKLIKKVNEEPLTEIK